MTIRTIIVAIVVIVLISGVYLFFTKIKKGEKISFPPSSSIVIPTIRR